MIVGYTMLHYGKDYLAYALRSLAPYVDRHVIIYSDKPTFGSWTDKQCPDSRDELKAIAQHELGDKLLWVEDRPQNYETVKSLLPQAQLILEVDADEVWSPALIAGVLRAHKEHDLQQGKHRIPMVHHWRSFDYVCHDTSWPIRLEVTTPFQVGDIPVDIWRGVIHHFGYARSIADTRYKIETSAHRGEWRAGWWDDVFMRFPARLTDLHPVVTDMWNAEPFDKQKLPDFMYDHPYFNMEVIS